MSEDRARFRIKVGEIEIEYEGKSTEVSMLYKEAFEWVKASAKIPSELKEEKEVKKRRGGPRTGVISQAIDRLIDEGFFDDFKNSTQVFEELKRRTIPVSRIERVITALNRKVPEKLDRIKDSQNRWVYRKKQ
jgi:uncharacterized protein YjhX (UPF0386 family)